MITALMVWTAVNVIVTVGLLLAICIGVKIRHEIQLGDRQIQEALARKHQDGIDNPWKN